MAARSQTEIELKLLVLDSHLLGELWRQETVFGWRVTDRRRERQRNVYYDTPDEALRSQGAGLRWRVVEGEPLGELTLKTGREQRDSIFRRSELTLELPAAADPLVGAPEAEPFAAARALVEGETGRLPLRSHLTLDTDRAIMQLERGPTRIELALDVVTMPGTPYRDEEIEAELKSVDSETSGRQALADLEAFRLALLATRRTRPTEHGKRGRALRYLARLAGAGR